jgi:hypothetical protein
MTYQEPEFKVSINQDILNREIIITNQDEFLQAGDVLKLCKNKIKEVEEERKSYTDPLEQSKKRLIAKAKAIIEPIEAYIDKINKAMSDWHIAQDKIRKEEEERIEKEKNDYYKKCQEEGKMPSDIDLMTKQPELIDTKTTKGNIATTSMVEKWDFEIVNPDEVERNLCSPDERLIRKAISDGARELKGIKITKSFKTISR